MTKRLILDQFDHLLAALGKGSGTATESILEDRVEGLAERLDRDRFQLAALGQFKRGKSTLLNALVQTQLLPTGAVPLTAIPTFISYGDPAHLHVTFADRPPLSMPTISDDIVAALADIATETGNPHNEKRVVRIDVAVPAPILRDGLVLIDTPGIGSAELHNSETAVATLPECDAALFVLSPDPPITEAELGYLAAVQRQAALIVPVLTKADTIAAEDLDMVRRYLAGVLARVGVTEPIVAVSARLPTIGIDRLGARIGAIAGDTRRGLLERAIVGKAVSTLDDLAFHNEASLAALRLPIGQLDDRIATFRQAAEAIGRENQTALDLTSGDRRRLLDMIDREAVEIRRRIQAKLATGFADAIDVGRNDTFEAVSSESSALFADAYRAATALVDAQFIGIAERARTRIAAILTEIREAAAETLGVAFRASEPEIEIETPKVLAWVERQRESMNPLPSGFFDRFMPAAVRARQQRRWLEREIERLATLNTENLRWTLRKQVEEILRRFDASIRQQLAGAETGMVDLMTRARDVRARSILESQAEIEAREHRGQALIAGLAGLRAAEQGPEGGRA